MLLIQRKYRLSHREQYLFSLSTKQLFLDQCIRKACYLILETEALTITLRRRGESEEKLRGVAVLSGVGHGQQAWRVVLRLKASFLVIELAPVDTIPCRAITLHDVPTLTAEAAHDPVKPTPLHYTSCEYDCSSVAVSAEISLRSPRKLFIFIIKRYIYRIEVSKNKLINFEKDFTEMQPMYWSGQPPKYLFSGAKHQMHIHLNF